MTKALKLFSLLFLFFFSAVSADAESNEERFLSFVGKIHKLYVVKVDPEFHCFSLTNNLVCNIPKKNWETDVLPGVGDEIFLVPFARIYDHRSSHIEQGELSVGVKDHQMPDQSKKPITVWISGESDYHLFYVRSDWHCIEPASGWLSPAVYEEFIILSDGSRWTRKKEEATVFEPGDRIIVGKVSEKEYLLIDLDRSVHKEISNNSKATTTKGKTLGSLACEKVDPLYPQKVTKE